MVSLIDLKGRHRKISHTKSLTGLLYLCCHKNFATMKTLLLSLLSLLSTVHGLVEPTSRRSALKWFGVTAATSLAPSAFAESTPESMDVDNFIRTGTVAMPMGVSGQAGKSRPETGVIFREGSDVSRDSRTGDVLAEILLDTNEGKTPYLASYSSPWPLAKGIVFDIECRDAKTGDGAFLAVTSSTKGKSMSQLSDQFFVDQLFAPTGRFSFYGPPTDVKVQKSTLEGDLRTVDLSFSTVSQATQTEIPRKARLTATIPSGSNQAVMLIVSSSAPRWKKSDVEKGAAQVMDSFRAIPAPRTSLTTRGKERRG
jgi:hypothetical protein